LDTLNHNKFLLF